MKFSYCEVASTWFGTGRVSRAPGTAGSAAALLLFPLVTAHYAVGLAVVTAVFSLGMFAVSSYMRRCPEKSDPKEVVIDEVCGQLLTLVLPSVAGRVCCLDLYTTYGFGVLWVFLVSGFLSFRLFDIVKPWPICLVDRKMKGALGVMLDDIFAAIAASILTLAAVNASVWY
ncbi:phosphatidylglycerophosphatase A [Anaplasma platys]|uniref:Phosphatidylglycerophosphatase A n=1 Tax=Anaplasma platys TaxID=949 RepID=A0A858PYV6_9RICK|nr:phosphatidylglycerophosphatase A [Anaplasma platys]QJC27759.1 phosphatidylglycerophosphatase A [Anaplasma platys]